MIHVIAGPGRLEVRGHAGYAPVGQDIVCAGVSALEMALIYTLEASGKDHTVELSERGDIITCDDPGALPWFEMAEHGLMAIEDAYPGHIKINE